MDIGRLRASAHRVAFRFMRPGSVPTPGVHRSLFRGHGLNFAGYREYQHGDDIRIVDWNVTARQNRPMLKLFEQEHASALMLVLDASPSMTGPHPDKWDAAAALAVLFAFVGARDGERLGLAVTGEKGLAFSAAPRLRAREPDRASARTARRRRAAHGPRSRRRSTTASIARCAACGRPASLVVDLGLPRHALGRRDPRGGAPPHRRRPDDLAARSSTSCRRPAWCASRTPSRAPRAGWTPARPASAPPTRSDRWRCAARSAPASSTPARCRWRSAPTGRWSASSPASAACGAPRDARCRASALRRSLPGQPAALRRRGGAHGQAGGSGAAAAAAPFTVRFRARAGPRPHRRSPDADDRRRRARPASSRCSRGSRSASATSTCCRSTRRRSRGRDGAWRQTWRVTLAAFDKGEPRVPRFALDYTAAGGQTLAYWADTGLTRDDHRAGRSPPTCRCGRSSGARTRRRSRRGRASR